MYTKMGKHNYIYDTLNTDYRCLWFPKLIENETAFLSTSANVMLALWSIKEVSKQKRKIKKTQNDNVS